MQAGAELTSMLGRYLQILAPAGGLQNPSLFRLCIGPQQSLKVKATGVDNSVLSDVLGACVYVHVHVCVNTARAGTL